MTGAAEPAKWRPGYANFAISEPPLKLVLIEGGGEPGALNHLGVEVETADQVRHATQTFNAQAIETENQTGVACCYALQDKVWVTDPDGARWEVYTVLGDAPSLGAVPTDSADVCCAPSDTSRSGELTPAETGTACC